MPLFDKTIEEEAMKIVSADTDISYNVVKDIVINGQSGFTKHVIESGGYNSVRWPKFGIFKIKTKFMLINKHMKGMSTIYRKIYKRALAENNRKLREKK